MKWPTFKGILGTFDKTTWILAQETHLLFGILAIIFCEAFNFPLWWGATGMLGIALIKETLIDPYDFEHNPFFWNGLIDFLMYCIGVGIGYGLVYLLK